MRIVTLVVLLFASAVVYSANSTICPTDKNLVGKIKDSITSLFSTKDRKCEDECDPALDPKECTDLLSKVLDPQATYDDGTGIAHPTGKAYMMFFSAAKKVKPSVEKRIKEFLKSEKGEYLLNTQVKSAFETTDIDKVAPLLSTYVLRRVGGATPFTSSEMPPAHDAMALDLIIANRSFMNAVVIPSEKELRSHVQKEDVAKKSREVFNEVKATMIDKISNSWDIKDENAKKAMIAKLRNIDYIGVDCAETFRNDKAVDGVPNLSGLMVMNAFYSPLNNAIQVCNAALVGNTSRFNIAFLMAHELGHSIDPCNIALGGISYPNLKSAKKSLNDYPVQGLLKCLRNPKSIGAERVEPIDKKSKVGAVNPKSPIASPFCRRKNAMETIQEATADWVAGEVVPEVAKKFEAKWTAEKVDPAEIKRRMRDGYSSVGHGIFTAPKKEKTTVPTTPDEKNVYPPMENRFRTLLLNPDVRNQMGCKAKPEDDLCYCRRDKK